MWIAQRSQPSGRRRAVTLCGPSIGTWRVPAVLLCNMYTFPGEVSDRSALPGSLVTGPTMYRVSLAAAITIIRPSVWMLRWALPVL